LNLGTGLKKRTGNGSTEEERLAGLVSGSGGVEIVEGVDGRVELFIVETKAMKETFRKFPDSVFVESSSKIGAKNFGLVALVSDITKLYFIVTDAAEKYAGNPH
jgi:hypothetical protein